jgi:DNA repair ATPase RecN
MYIRRIQIEEGFLHGLDVQMSPGLNVVIGARGTGKSSLIELIRYCLAVPANTQETARRARDHALSVLGPGQVTITLADDNREVLVTRSSSDERPRSTGVFESPLIFSQTEIETVGLQAQGRLRLLDSFGGRISADRRGEEQALAEFSSLNVEVEKARREIDDLERQLSALKAVQDQLVQNVVAERDVERQSGEIAEKKRLLDAYAVEISRKAVVEEAGERAMLRLAGWYEALRAAHDAAPKAEELPSFEVLQSLGAEVAQITDELNQAMNRVSAVYYRVKEVADVEATAKAKLEGEARQVRKVVESLSEGSGQILRRGQQLREQEAKLLALREYLSVHKSKLEALLARRAAALDKLDDARLTRFKARSATVKTLNKTLGPRIRIKHLQNAQTHAFASAVADALKGSGLRFSDIAQSIASTLSPRALLDAVESFDSKLVAEVAGISEERAARALAHLRASDLGTLGGIEIEDDATFQLLDGKDYKDFSELSTGQRCTVVLPVVLAHERKIIVVDQPEDHIDNAFIADTLINAILQRDEHTQIIFTTHNPNIPVLGNADYVVHLGSDGRRGFVLAAGGLDQSNVIEAISKVMEGGAEAFARRSAFYAQLV